MQSSYHPITVTMGQDDLISPQRQKQLIWLFLILGLTARLVRYFLCFPLWEDECFLCFNFIDRDFVELLEPLNYRQVAPILFLWLELAMTRLLGFTEFSLRLFPFLAGVASLFLFYHVARRLLDGPALVAAVAIFSVAYPCIRYTAEAKPYGPDLLVSLVFVALTVEWWRHPDRTQYLWAMIFFMPMAMGLSFPVVFTGGGISLFIAYQLWKSPRAPGWTAWVCYNVMLVGCFIGYYLLTMSIQSNITTGFMLHFWADAFPPTTSVSEFLSWASITHTSNLFAYPFGGDGGMSLLTFIGILCGLIFLVRRRHFSVLLLFLVPLGLHFIAALLHKYPYGVHVKYSQYIAPMICMVAGIGGIAMFSFVFRTVSFRRGSILAWIGLLALVGSISIVRDIAFPYKTLTDQRSRAFAQWFWYNSSYDTVTACLKTDLETDFSEETFRELSWSAMYLCNQHIYRPRDNVDWNQVSTDKPLRIVQYKDTRFPFDEDRFERWMTDMRESHELIGKVKFAFPRLCKQNSRLNSLDYIEVYSFVPMHAKTNILQTLHNPPGNKTGKTQKAN